MIHQCQSNDMLRLFRGNLESIFTFRGNPYLRQITSILNWYHLQIQLFFLLIFQVSTLYIYSSLQHSTNILRIGLVIFRANTLSRVEYVNHEYVRIRIRNHQCNLKN